MNKTLLIGYTILVLCLAIVGSAQSGRTPTAEPDRAPGSRRDSGAASASGREKPKALLTRWGTNVIEITVVSGAPDNGARRSPIYEKTLLNGRTVLRTVRLGENTTREYECGPGQTMMELDEDGDGLFETLLFVARGGEDVVGFKRSATGDVAALGDARVGEMKERLFPDNRPSKATDPSGVKNCMWNLKQIEGAKQQWAILGEKSEHDIPEAAVLSPFIEGGFSSLNCPKGGTYTIGSISQTPSCSVHGQLK